MKRFLIILLLVITTLTASSAQAVTVAVFPVEDLSEGSNGVNFPLTDFLRQSLQTRGLEVLPTSDVVSYMSRNRIRCLGALGKSHTYQAHEDLGADFIVLGTVSQHQEKPLASFGLVLTLVRASDAHVVWTEAGGVSKADATKMFAVDEPQNTEELLTLLVNQLFESLPLLQESAESIQSMVIETVRFSPRHVKAGDEVKCLITLRPPEGHDLISQVFLQINNDNFLDMVEVSPNQYSTYWVAPDQEGISPVNLILLSQSGKKNVYYLGNYQIDTSAPELNLSISGKKVNNFAVFSTSLPIVAVWKNPEPLSRWSLYIQSSAGQVMSCTESTGALPAYFVWNGQKPDGHKAEDGIYDIVLKVWDRAENISFAAQKVLLKANPPVPRFNGVPGDNGIVVTIDSEDRAFVDFWSVEFMYSDGEVLLRSQGNELPADLNLPPSVLDDSRKLEGVVTMKDMLGNKIQKKIDDLHQVVKIKELTPETQIKQEWFPEF